MYKSINVPTGYVGAVVIKAQHFAEGCWKSVDVSSVHLTLNCNCCAMPD
jgi:hypothetical protein